MIDADLKAKWVAALRSGEYQQGRMALETSDGCNCCLGVLMRVNGEVATNLPPELDYYAGKYRVFGESLNYPPQGYCGLSSDNFSELSRMNDDGNSFSQIADHIEKTL